jgi:hypothetical protein
VNMQVNRPLEHLRDTVRHHCATAKAWRP